MEEELSHFFGNYEPALKLLTMPRDTNSAGDISGGWIMTQVDTAGAIVASQVARCRVVTIAVTNFLFKQPVFVGDLVSCYGKIEKIGRTSITVHVEVCVQRNRFEDRCIKVTEATVVYVAVDEERRPREIPQNLKDMYIEKENSAKITERGQRT